MQFFEISGGNRLKGSVEIHGAKNSALPIMAASILVEGETVLRNVPDLADIHQMQELLGRLGVEAKRDEDGAMRLRVVDEMAVHAPYELVSKMRASVCVMGPLLAKRRRAQVSMPGGCAIGDRPIGAAFPETKAAAARSTTQESSEPLRGWRSRDHRARTTAGTSQASDVPSRVHLRRSRTSSEA